METGLQSSAACDWPVAQKERGLEGPLWSVHGCPFVWKVCPSTGQRKPSSLTFKCIFSPETVVGGVRRVLRC